MSKPSSTLNTIPMMTEATQRPLCIDLDGTLIATDSLWEALLMLVKHHPLKLWRLPLWLLGGKAHFKRQIASLVSLKPDQLPYRPSVLSLIKQARSSGRAVVLATGTDMLIADPIARHLGLFTDVLASDGFTNLSGRHKREALVRRFGAKGFDYIGNSTADLPIWEMAHTAMVARPSGVIDVTTMEQLSQGNLGTWSSLSLHQILRALRTYQWVKNLLLFIPLALAHKLFDPHLLMKVTVAFLGFNFSASAIYVVNDLLDLSADRAHPRKSKRPFASGALSIPTGLLLATTCLSAGLGLSWYLLPPMFTCLLALYVGLSLLYCVRLKKAVVADVIGLAMLYSIRVLAGGAAAEVLVSQWLLTFSMFFFVSLAFMKRFSELYSAQQSHRDPEGRPYTTSDLEMVRSVGPSTGYISILVLALYINSQDVTVLYKSPVVLWLTGPALLYWITRMWFLAARGEMHDDPIVTAVKDYRSYVAGLFVLLAVYFAI